jgi:hypothetical protein
MNFPWVTSFPATYLTGFSMKMDVACSSEMLVSACKTIHSIVDINSVNIGPKPAFVPRGKQQSYYFESFSFTL